MARNTAYGTRSQGNDDPVLPIRNSVIFLEKTLIAGILFKTIDNNNRSGTK